jgi:hypothetical protein
MRHLVNLCGNKGSKLMRKIDNLHTWIYLLYEMLRVSVIKFLRNITMNQISNKLIMYLWCMRQGFIRFWTKKKIHVVCIQNIPNP